MLHKTFAELVILVLQCCLPQNGILSWLSYLCDSHCFPLAGWHLQSEPSGTEAAGPAPGDAFVPLDAEVLVAFEQKGMFPPLDRHIPKMNILHVTMTRRLDLAEDWAKAREEEGVTWFGYLIRTRKVPWKRRWKVVSAGIKDGKLSLICCIFIYCCTLSILSITYYLVTILLLHGC